MRYDSLEDVSGTGKFINMRDKGGTVPYCAGLIEDEVSVSDGEHKYFIQFVGLADDVLVEGEEATRKVLRFGYYTSRADGRFCLGSQYAPIMTLSEFSTLMAMATAKGWF